MPDPRRPRQGDQPSLARGCFFQQRAEFRQLRSPPHVGREATAQGLLEAATRTGLTQHPMRRELLAHPAKRLGLERLGDEVGSHPPLGALAEQDLIRLCQGAQSGGGVHRRAGQVEDTIAHVAHLTQHLTGVNAGVKVKLPGRSTAADGIALQEAVQLQGRRHRAPGVIVMTRLESRNTAITSSPTNWFTMPPWSSTM